VLVKLCDNLEIEFQDDLLHFQDKTNIVRDHGWFETAKQLHTKRIGKWRDPKFKNRLNEFMTNKEAVELLKHLKYPVET